MIPPRLSAVEEEKDELASLLAYKEIARSSNLVRLLSFVCEKYFEGKSGEIRESSIAIHALGRRGTNFDSQADPIVRVTARTLRKRLDAYYFKEGRNHSLRLVLPLGQYVPKFVPWNPDGDDGVSQPIAEPEKAECPERSDLNASNVDGGVEVSSTENPGDRVGLVASTARFGVMAKIFAEWRKVALVLLVLAVASSTSFWFGRRSTLNRTESSSAVTWGEPVWSDEFAGPAGEPPDSSKWSYDTGRGSEFGGDMLTYCAPGSSEPAPCDAHRPNVMKDGAGHLIIRAIKDKNGQWTSARIKTQNLHDFQYGRIEARMKLPAGNGLWPAFWMLGSNFSKVGWPSSGSVDFMENVSTPNRPGSLGSTMIRAAIHGPGYSGGNGLWQNYILPGGGRINDDSFHTYGAIWSPNMIQFYVDDPSNVFFVKTASDVPVGGQWVLNDRFFLILNLAIGGVWAGSPDVSTPNPSEILVDYVRVYKADRISGPRISASPIEVRAGYSATTTVTLKGATGSGRTYISCIGAPPNSSCSLAAPIVDFSNVGVQQDTLKVETGPMPGTGKVATSPGDYNLTIAATTVSGDTSSFNVPLRIR